MTSSHPFAPIIEAVPAFGEAIRRHDAGDLAAARAAYLDLIDQPNLTALCLHQLGLIASARGEHGKAVELLRRSIRLEPQQILAYGNLRTALDRMGDTAGAVAILVDMGCVVHNQGDYSQAAAICRETLARDPLSYPGHVNLGTALAWQYDYRPAIRHLLLGIGLFGRLVPEVGLFGVEIAARLADFLGDPLPVLPPGPPSGSIEKIEDALTTLGKILNECGRPAESLICLRRSVEWAPGFALGRWNLSLALLTEGDFTQGWRDYEWRWQWDRFPEPRRLLPAPLWRGEEPKGRRILVWSEQGYGDAMQFAPLARELAERGARVVLEAPAALVRLLGHSFPMLEVVGRPEHPHRLPIDDVPDFVVPLMSLPERLGLERSRLPLAKGYLVAPDEDAGFWKERLPQSAQPRVGLVWAGRPAHADDAKRSAPFEKLLPLLDVPGLLWHSLQVGPRQEDLAAAAGRVDDLAPYLGDFADTATAVARLDLVIAVDTSVAHLAAGMGKPVWLMLPQVADWRWGREGAETPWYPSVRQFRQRRPGEWDAVVEEIGRALVALSDGSH